MATKYQTYNTPIGVASFPHLMEARQYKGKGPYMYECTLVYPEDQEGVPELLKLIDDEIDEAVTQHKAKKGRADAPYGPHYIKDEDGDDEEVEGFVAVRFKVPAEMETRAGGTWDRQPAFFDAAGNGIPPQNVGGGSRIGLSYQIYRWKNPDKKGGVRLEPTGVQIIDFVLNTGGGDRDAKAFGFTPQKGTFTQDQATAAPPPIERDEPVEQDDDAASGKSGGDF